MAKIKEDCEELTIFVSLIICGVCLFANLSFVVGWMLTAEEKLFALALQFFSSLRKTQLLFETFNPENTKLLKQ